MQNKVTYFLAFVIAAAAIAQGQTATDFHQSIRRGVEQKNWPSVISEVSKLRTSDPNTFTTSNYDYLLARAAEMTGDRAIAIGSYQAVVTRNARLSEYALWHLSRMARTTGDLILEREQLRRLIASSTNILLYDVAVLRLTESFFESGDFASAANAARLGISSKSLPTSRKSQLWLGQALTREGKTTEARDTFTKLVLQMPDASRPDDFALEAVRQLDKIENTSQTQLSEAERLLRASVYQFNRDFVAARAHYEVIIQQNPHSPTVPNAMYQLARGFYLEGKYPEAINYFQKVANQFPESPSARDALGFLGSTYVRLKRTDDAVAAYKTLIDRFPDGAGLERAYLNIVDAFHEASRYSEALNWIQQTRSRFKGEIGASLALFSQLRIHLAQQAWQDAIRDADELLKFPDLGGTKVAGGTSTSEVGFLKGYALERSGRIEEAITVYLAIPDGRNEYYGTRATNRLLSLAANEKSSALISNRRNAFVATLKSGNADRRFDDARTAAHAALRLTIDGDLRTEILNILRDVYSASPSYQLRTFAEVSLVRDSPVSENGDAHQRLANELFSLGLYDEAMPELFAARAARGSSTGQTQGNVGSARTAPGLTDEDYSIAQHSLKARLPNRAVRFAEQFWRMVPADYVIELAPRPLLELLYPVPYRESVLKHAPSRKVDPRFVLSIARQESRYQADAKSVAAARGMMQFISSTASDVATELKLTNFTQDSLYDPDTAILFGSQYLGSLFKQFPDQPEAVAGSYNGGPDNIVRWIGRSRATEPERYVPEIGFAQTKDYVYRVMSNFWTYQRLYDEQLRLRD